jgi:hemerythrin-like domain-containing protein
MPKRATRPRPDLLELLGREHGNFARLMSQFETQLELFRMGGLPDYELMRDIMLYMSQYPDQVHHPREDRIIERLQQRLHGSPRSLELLRHLMQDHEQMAARATELVAALDSIGGDAVYPREAVILKAEAYATQLRQHMDEEERTFMPLAREHLTPTDWAALARAMPEGDDPLAAARIDPAHRALFARMGALRDGT